MLEFILLLAIINILFFGYVYLITREGMGPASTKMQGTTLKEFSKNCEELRNKQ